ncbi:nucleolar protein 58 [Polyergus mexicanus]|uniref:nucleolar protein 58 n=1 Tax=Polyergus mexicanus TaxID=615972 RepID=UPI0038B5C5E9
MAPRKQVKEVAETTVALAAADGNATPPKKRKTVTKSRDTATPKQAKTAIPRQLRQTKEREVATVFSPKYLRSRNKNVAPKNDTGNENESKKTTVDKEQKEKTVVKNNNTGERVVKKVQKKAPTGAKSAVKNAEENPPKKTRRGKTVDEENVAPVVPAATKMRFSKKLTKIAETEAIAEVGDEPPEEKKDAQMIVAGKKSREQAKKTAKITVKEKSKKNFIKAEVAVVENEEEGIEEQNSQNSTIEEAKKRLKENSATAERVFISILQ